jgi:hypothetical protein
MAPNFASAFSTLEIAKNPATGILELPSCLGVWWADPFLPPGRGDR